MAGAGAPSHPQAPSLLQLSCTCVHKASAGLANAGDRRTDAAEHGRHRVFVSDVRDEQKTENTQPPRTENARGGAKQYAFGFTIWMPQQRYTYSATALSRTLRHRAQLES